MPAEDDQPRAVSRFGDDGSHWQHSAKLLAAVLHLQRGTPYIFQGEELGMTNADFAAIDEIRDIESLNFFAEATGAGQSSANAALEGIRRSGRDNARTPMQWNPTANAGFTSGEPWIGVNPNTLSINASVQVNDPESVFSFYRELIALRHCDPVVVHGDFDMLAPDHPALFAYTRRRGESTLLVLANFRGTSLRLSDISDIVENLDARLVLGNYSPAEGSGAAAALRPWEVRVLRVGP